MPRLATSSFDKTVRVWDADNVSGHSFLLDFLYFFLLWCIYVLFCFWISFGIYFLHHCCLVEVNTMHHYSWLSLQPGYSLRTFMGHSASVMSLDFHPNKDDLICSCDGDGEIRYWSINNGSCTRVFKVESFCCWCVNAMNRPCFWDKLDAGDSLFINANIFCGLGWYGSDEIPAPSWKVSCRSCRECCLYTGCGDSSLSSFIAG